MIPPNAFGSDQPLRCCGLHTRRVPHSGRSIMQGADNDFDYRFGMEFRSLKTPLNGLFDLHTSYFRERKSNTPA